MRDGEAIRLIGDAGAVFVTTVGSPFSADYIAKQLEAGTWKRPESAPKRRSRPATKRTTRKS